ncbi:OCIA domain-containing protein 1 isoform X2 [Manduca sexta]|uniref:OCIA domain-containing protein n=1 Tax=Manduca sexta TaxID=7130 RepID=A0A922CW97_MANSE|nr:OCIA domain-containing protein 1 isoform X2 [Manduca sexta]KAG6461870.1 hypothetical protein O3G_MSEX012910 [Manduca sexta]
MDDPRNFGYQDGSGAMGSPHTPFQQSPHQPGMPVQQHKFSPDELRVLAECNRDSFYQRCLPIGTALGLTAYAAVQRGHLKPNPRFGAFPKVSLAVVVGYFLGKLSYQQACAEKLMALPGSYIGQLLRERRDGKIGSTSLQPQAPSMFGASPSDIYSDAGPGSSLDLDTDRPLFSDDTYRPDSDGGGGAAAGLGEAAPAQPALSYEDLRRKNRGAYTDSKQDPYRVEPSGAPTSSSSRMRASPPPPATAPAPAPATNKYGDAME